MTEDGERRIDPSLRAVMEGIARETARATLAGIEAAVAKAAAKASTEACHALLLRLDIDMDDPAAVRTYTENIRWVYRTRKVSEKGRMIFFGVLATVISYWILSSIWEGFGKAVRAVIPAVPVIAALLLALALLGCAAAPSPAPSYWPELEEWNRRWCVQRGGEWRAEERKCEGASR